MISISEYFDAEEYQDDGCSDSSSEGSSSADNDNESITSDNSECTTECGPHLDDSGMYTITP